MYTYAPQKNTTPSASVIIYYLNLQQKPQYKKEEQPVIQKAALLDYKLVTRTMRTHCAMISSIFKQCYDLFGRASVLNDFHSFHLLVMNLPFYASVNPAQKTIYNRKIRQIKWLPSMWFSTTTTGMLTNTAPHILLVRNLVNIEAQLTC